MISYLNLDKQTLYESVYNTAITYPKRKAFYYKGKYYNYEYLLSKINNFAYHFKKLGFKKDDVITVCLPNIPEALYLFYAINQIGAIANVIHPLMKEEQLEEILKRCDSRILFVLDTRYNEFKKLNNEGIKVYSVSPTHECNFILNFLYHRINKKDLTYLKDKNSYYSINEFYKEKEKITEFDKDNKKDCVYLHSGGTTGNPKTIALSSYAINNVCLSCYEVLNFKEGEVTYVLSVLPMFHGFGLTICMHIELAYGGCDMLMPKFSSKETIKFLKKGKLNFIVGVPILFEGLLRNKDFKGKNLASLRNCFVGGDFVSDSLLERFNKRMEEANSSCRLGVGYGLTETVTVCSVNSIKETKKGTVGKPLRNVKAGIIDENNNLLKPNEKGEIIIGGPTLMNGYRHSVNSEGDNIFIDFDNEKYIKTGDYGYIDEEGYIHFEQRIKRLIKVNGINIFPSEIENIVNSLPYVFENAAIGVSDDRFGLMIKLFVVLDRDYPKNFGKYSEEINNLIVNKASIYAKPKEIVYVEKLPKTLIGKIDVKKLH